MFEALSSYQNTLTSDKDSYVCGTMQPHSYSARFSKLLERFNMPHIRFHDLRHYNAVIMMKYGIPDKVAAKHLGHCNTKTLKEVYQHVLTDMDIDAANKINKLFTNKIG